MFRLFQRKIFSLLLFLIFSSSLMAQNGSNTTKLGYYRYNPERLSWQEHKKRAAQMGGHLACIRNATENEQVRRIAGGEIVWIGGIRRNCGNGPGSKHWKWSNGKIWNYTNWSAGEPNNHAELNENRVWLYDNGKWNDAPSWVELPAVYEIPSNASVTDDTQSTSSVPMSLTISGAGSPEVNGNYVFVENHHRNRIFDTEPGHYQHTTNPAIFIGFQNCGRLFNKPEWNKWVIFTEKGARYAAHTSRQINVPPRIGKWETIHHWPAGVQEAGFHPAPTLHYEIAKRTRNRQIFNQFSENVHVNTGQPSQNKALPKSLSYYKFIPEKLTWAEHNNRAIAMGGNLASISNALENEQVRKIIHCEGVWIGGVRKGCGNDTGADHWYWSNGKEWLFTNWQQYEPNNYGDVNENRVQMLNNGNWNDLPDEIPMAAVYELPLENTKDYYHNTNTNYLEEPKIKKRPFKFILGPVIAVGSFFQFKKIKSREIEN